MTPDEAITIVTTACAVPSCPSTWIIDRVYGSGRGHLPTARWLFLFDGVHAIQEDMRREYEVYKEILKARIDIGIWENSEFMEFSEWGHQGTMIREALRQNRIHTPLVLWLESDFPLSKEPIDWPAITDCLLASEVDYIRFALPEEKREGLGAPVANSYDVPMTKTLNYSSLPHVCRIQLLQRLMLEFIKGTDHLECVATEGIAFREPQWRLAVYTPPGVLARFYSLDGRAGWKKPPTEW
jgi:hypothetical protein